MDDEQKIRVYDMFEARKTGRPDRCRRPARFRVLDGGRRIR